MIDKIAANVHPPSPETLDSLSNVSALMNPSNDPPSTIAKIKYKTARINLNQFKSYLFHFVTFSKLEILNDSFVSVIENIKS